MEQWQKLGGIFLVLIGAFGLFLGARYIFGFEQIQPENTQSCRAICGLGLLVAQLIGEKVGMLLVGFLWLLAGSWLTYLGYCFLIKEPN